MKKLYFLLLLLPFALSCSDNKEVSFDKLQNRSSDNLEPFLFEINSENGFTGTVINEKALLNEFTIVIPLVLLRDIDSSRCSYKNGRKNGNSTFYSKSKKVLSENFSEGKLEGISTAYYSSGQKLKEIKYENEKSIVIGEWEENGVKKIPTK
jgi:hypothetical protein